MLKRFLLIFVLLTTLSVSAGELDKLIVKGRKVFLYLYTPECTYCVKFNPIYEKFSKKYGDDCEFLKIDANTKEGGYLMYETRATYVPNVIIIDPQKQSLGKITPDCLLNDTCMTKLMKNFLDK